ncbi:hypothetical protein D3C78_1130550 [compost metagenome]
MHHRDERALGLTGLYPRHDRQHQGQGQQVKHHQPYHGRAEGFLDRPLRVLGFTGRHRDHFHAQVAEDRHNYCHPHPLQAMGEEAAVSGVMLHPVIRVAGTEHHVHRQDDEADNRRDLDGREPVLEGAESLHADGVEHDQHTGERDDPDPFRHVGEPVLHVHRHRRHFRAHCQHNRRPIGIAHQEPGQWADIEFGIGAERA